MTSLAFSISKTRKRQILLFLPLSMLLGYLYQIHGFILDLNPIAFRRATFEGWAISCFAIYVALVLVSWALTYNCQKK